MKTRYLVLLFLITLSALTFVDRVAIAAAGDTIMTDLGLSAKQWGWVLGMFTLSYGLFQIPIGAWADKSGQRLVIAAIVLWWSLFTFLTGMAGTFALLLVVRFMFGIGEAGAYPAMSGSIARWFPAREHARAQGFMWAASRIGGALSALLVVPIQKAFGWQTVFYFLGVIGVVWVMVWYGWYRNFPSEKPGISEAELLDIQEGIKEKPKAVAIPWLRILSRGQFWIILTMYGCYVWGSWFFFSWWHTYLVKGRGMSQEEMAFFSAFPFLLSMGANVAGGFVSDFLSHRLGRKLGRRLTGTVSLALAAVLMALTPTLPGKVAAVALLSLSFGAMDLMLPSAWAVCLDVGRKYAGAITGAMNTAGNLSGFLCVIVFGNMVGENTGYDRPMYLIAAMLALSSVLFLFINSSKPLVPDEPEPASSPN
jgi:MFS family permease